MKGRDLNAHLLMGLKGMTQENLMMWMGTCNACGKMPQVGHGLFCSNFWLGWEDLSSCRYHPFPRL